MKIPKVFISYSHDSLEHKHWVLEMASRLRNSGIDAVLDQWELKPGSDLTHFMESNLASSDKVIMVCTVNYVAKANSGAGGVGYEKMIMTADYMHGIDSAKVIPIIRQNSPNPVPTFLRSKLYLDFTKSASFEFSFDELVRTIHNAPLFEKPPIGNNPFTPARKLAPPPKSDNLLKLMKIVIDDFDKGKNWTDYNYGLARFGASRIYYDATISEAVEKGLVELDYLSNMSLIAGGKRYALENNLVK